LKDASSCLSFFIFIYDSFGASPIMARAHEEWRKSVARVMPVFLRSQNKKHFSIKKYVISDFFRNIAP